MSFPEPARLPSWEEEHRAKAMNLFRNTAMPKKWKQMAWELAYRHGQIDEDQYAEFPIPENIKSMSLHKLTANVLSEARRNQHLLRQEFIRGEDEEFLRRARGL